MKRMSRLILLVAVLFVVVSLPASKAQASGGTCRISCDNGITVEGWSSSYNECLQSFAGNCSQWGWYGGSFCYFGDDAWGCWTY